MQKVGQIAKRDRFKEPEPGMQNDLDLFTNLLTPSSKLASMLAQ